MSGLILIRQRRRITLIADAAAYTRDGRLGAVRSKLFTGGTAPLVIAWRGHSPAHGRSPDAWPTARGLADVLQMFDSYLDLALDEICRSDPACTAPRVELVAAGWSEDRAAFEAWGISNIPSGARQGVC